MNPELMKHLCRAFLMYKFPDSYQEGWLNNKVTCDLLRDAIDRIDGWGDEVLHLNELESSPEQFASFLSLLDKSLTFSNHTPPRCTAFNEEILDANLDHPENFWIPLAPDLPDSNYTSRATGPGSNTNSPKYNVGNQETLSFEELKAAASETLARLLYERFPKLKLKDLEKVISEVEELVEKEKKLLKSQESRGNKPDTTRLDALETDLNLLKDANKVFKLSVIMIPNEDGTPTDYCILQDSAGGVTEKYSLIKMQDAIDQLVALYSNRDTTDLDAYLTNRDSYKLSTQGILKLPKHGKTIEVQREAIALNISRILGFTTTKSTMVEYEGKAALFIPFDRIQLLNEFAAGEVQRVVVPSSFTGITKIGDEYLHYSTIVPVGNRLNSDQTIEDFGKVMAFSYLCNDTDFIGMKNQNKAIKDGSELYMFDQVVMSKEKMALDSRLSLVPIGFGRHSRHNQGRNRSIIEDSSFEAKFNSIVNLIEHKEDINLMLDNISYSHLSKISKLQEAITTLSTKGKSLSSKEKAELKDLKKQLKEVEILIEDVIEVKKTVNQRMESLFANFPRINGQEMNSQLFLMTRPLLRGCLILEKLVNKPVLFTEDGRPYRNPWTYRNNNKIDAITIKGENAHISFSKMNTLQMLAILRQAGVNLRNYDQVGNTIILPVSELVNIKENCLFPERDPFNMSTDYLDPDILKQNLSGYGDDNQDALIAQLIDYRREVHKAGNNSKRVVSAMESMLNAIRDFGSDNKGMLKHAELNLQLAMQQKLQAIILKVHPELEAGLEKALKAAVKLDSLNDLNHVLMNYVKYDCKNTPLLVDYLGKCIAHGANAGNYTQAKTESDVLYKESIDLYHAFKNRHKNSISQIMGSLEEHALHESIVSLGEEWEDVDVPLLTDKDKIEEEEALHKDLDESVTPPTTATTTTTEVLKPGITVGGKP